MQRLCNFGVVVKNDAENDEATIQICPRDRWRRSLRICSVGQAHCRHKGVYGSRSTLWDMGHGTSDMGKWEGEAFAEPIEWNMGEETWDTERD